MTGPPDNAVFGTGAPPGQEEMIGPQAGPEFFARGNTGSFGVVSQVTQRRFEQHFVAKSRRRSEFDFAVEQDGFDIAFGEYR